MYLAPRRAMCLTTPDPWKLIRSARSETRERTGISSKTSISIPKPPSDTSRHLPCAYLEVPRSSSQEMRSGPGNGVRGCRRRSFLSISTPSPVIGGDEWTLYDPGGKARRRCKGCPRHGDFGFASVPQGGLKTKASHQPSAG